MSEASPEAIAAAWVSWHERHGGKLGPGPAFSEAIRAALDVEVPAIRAQARNAALEEAARVADRSSALCLENARYASAAIRHDRETAAAEEAKIIAAAIRALKDGEG